MGQGGLLCSSPCWHWGLAGNNGPQGPTVPPRAPWLRTSREVDPGTAPQSGQTSWAWFWHAACGCFVLLHIMWRGSFTALCPLPGKAETQVALLPATARGTQQSRAVLRCSSPTESINPLPPRLLPVQYTDPDGETEARGCV